MNEPTLLNRGTVFELAMTQGQMVYLNATATLGEAELCPMMQDASI